MLNAGFTVYNAQFGFVFSLKRTGLLATEAQRRTTSKLQPSINRAHESVLWNQIGFVFSVFRPN
jgi:hypothetical protein